MIGRFAAAVQSGDVQQIKQAYPNLTDGQRKKWEELFRGAKPEDAEITNVKGVSGPDATGTTIVDFTMAVRFTDRANGTPVRLPPTRYRARLKRYGSNLLLESLIDRPPGSR